MLAMKRLFTLIMFVQGHIVFAQTLFSLRPYIGIQTPFSQVVNNQTGINTFNNNTININIDYSIFLDVNFKNKSKLSVGYTNWGINGTQFDVSIPKPSRSNNFKQASITFGLTENIHKIQLRYAHQLLNLPLVRRSKHRDFAINDLAKPCFLIKPFVGFGLDAVNSNIQTGLYPSPLPFEFFGDTIKNLVADIHRLNKKGVSLQVGFDLQFKRKGRESIALTICYNQGLIALNNYGISYYLRSDRMSGKTYYTTIKSMASSLSANLSFPIQLYSRNDVSESLLNEQTYFLKAKQGVDRITVKKNYRKRNILVGINGWSVPLSLVIGGRVGYLIADNFVMGVEIRHSQLKQDDLIFKSTTVEQGLGVIGRYYFAAKKIAPFLQTGVSLGSYRFYNVSGGRPSYKYNTSYIHLLPGISIQALKSLKVDLGIQLENNSRQSGTLNNLTPHIGLHYTWLQP